MVKETLLQQAKKVAVRSVIAADITDEHIELAIAWINNEITTKQVAYVLKLDKTKYAGSVLYRIATFLKKAQEQGKIIIKLKNK